MTTTGALQGVEGVTNLSLKVQGSPFDPHMNQATAQSASPGTVPLPDMPKGTIARVHRIEQVQR